MSLYIFDKDGTLVRRVRSRFFVRRSALKPEEQVLRKGVFEKLAKLRAAGHTIAIATNQPYVAHGSSPYRKRKSWSRTVLPK